MKHAVLKLEDSIPARGRVATADARGFHAAAERRTAALCAVSAISVLLVWTVYLWSSARPSEIAADWHGWRQTDTQTIALNFTRSGSSVFWPQVSWGNDGPGYVETEFQLYPKMMSLLMGVVGPVEWIGQLVSLIAIAGAAGMVFFHLSQQHRPEAALLGFAAFLAARTSPHLATVVMPDALALLAYITAWAFFSRFVRDGRSLDLAWYGFAGTLAMLIKPTTAHLGISSFLLIALLARPRLKEARVWIVWTLMVLVFSSYLLHAHRIYADYGNTFGLLVGEDSKAPKLRYLLMPGLFIAAARFAVNWGLGPIAAAILIVQAVRRRLTAEQLALATGNIAIVIVAFRYMSDWAGTHYYAPASLLAASVVATVMEKIPATRWRQAAFAVMGVLLVAQGYRNILLRQGSVWFFRQDPTVASVVATGHAMRQFTAPDDLIVVRSPNAAYDAFWQQAANYHDPRIFYLSRTRGWTLGREQDSPTILAQAAHRGARFFADPLTEHAPRLDAWLTGNAVLVWSSGQGGRIWKLRAGDLP